MGFRKDAYATCWEAKPVSDTMTSVQLSVSKKDKDGEVYVQDFSGFVAFVGTATAKKAAKLSKRDRIKLGDVDVTTKYDKDKNKTYTNFTEVFSLSAHRAGHQHPPLKHLRTNVCFYYPRQIQS